MQLLPYKNNYRYLVFALNTYILYILEDNPLSLYYSLHQTQIINIHIIKYDKFF